MLRLTQKKKPILYVITSLYRYTKLNQLASSLQLLDSLFAVRWFPIGDTFDGTDGCSKRNIAMKMIENLDSGWIYNLDDDNKIHPSFPQSLYDGIQTKKSEVFFFRQLLSNDKFYIEFPELLRTKIDTGGFVVSTSAAQGIDWNWDDKKCPDYHWIFRVCQKGYKPILLDGFTYYNGLNVLADKS